ncbi:HAD-IA family hydrolase [Achromobacter xylosoxidans]
MRALPGVHETLAALRQRGIEYCVASSSTPPKLEAALKLVGLWEEFAPNVFSTAQVAHGKPAPDVFLFAARQMRTAILECVVVEDSVPGVRAAAPRVCGRWATSARRTTGRTSASACWTKARSRSSATCSACRR